MLPQYQSKDAYDTAVDSYGGVNNVYLTPNGVLNPEATEEAGSGGSDTENGSDSGGGSAGGGTNIDEGGNGDIGE